MVRSATCVEREGFGRCSRGHGDERIGEMEAKVLLLEVTWLLSREGIANNTLILTAYRGYARRLNVQLLTLFTASYHLRRALCDSH
jgi:hypothetical protein